MKDTDEKCCDYPAHVNHDICYFRTSRAKQSLAALAAIIEDTTMSTYNPPKVPTLDSLNDEIIVQEMLVRNHREDSWYTLDEAKEGLRKAKEALRVFIYRAKPSISKNGKAIRR